MNLNVIDNEIYIYDNEMKKNSWCSVHLTNIVNGYYCIKEKDNKYYLIAKRYRRIRKQWEITDDELGIDTGNIMIETGRTKLEIDLGDVPKNTVMTVSVCRNVEGMIFGICWEF